MLILGGLVTGMLFVDDAQRDGAMPWRIIQQKYQETVVLT